jgi:hypothetical protein
MGTIAGGMDAPDCYANARRRGSRPGSTSTFPGHNCSASAA